MAWKLCRPVVDITGTSNNNVRIMLKAIFGLILVWSDDLRPYHTYLQQGKLHYRFLLERV